MTDLAVEGQPSQEHEGAASAGRLLKQARERQQVDIAVLAAMLKVSEQKIRALENDEVDKLPDVAFARSLAASIARMLDLDPAPVLALLPKNITTVRTVYEPLNAPYQPQSDGGVIGRAVFSTLQSRYLWVVLGLLMAAVVLAMLPQLQDEQRSEADAANGAQTDGTVTREVSSPSVPAATHEPPPVVPAVPLVPAASAALVVPQPAASAAQPVAVAPYTAASDLSMNSGDLHLITTQDSWIQVRDAAGKTLFSRTLKAGEDVPLTGVPPYKLVIGSVAGVSLVVRGQNFDLAGVAKGGTTARFDVP